MIAGPINRLLPGELNITFYCESKKSNENNVTMDSHENEKKNLLNYFVVKNGVIEKNETLADFTEEYVAYLLNEFKLTDFLEKKYLGSGEHFIFYFIFLLKLKFFSFELSQNFFWINKKKAIKCIHFYN